MIFFNSTIYGQNIIYGGALVTIWSIRKSGTGGGAVGPWRCMLGVGV